MFLFAFFSVVFGGSTAAGWYLSRLSKRGRPVLDRDLIANDDDIRRMRHLMTTVRKMSLSSLLFSHFSFVMSLGRSQTGDYQREVSSSCPLRRILTEEGQMTR